MLELTDTKWKMPTVMKLPLFFLTDLAVFWKSIAVWTHRLKTVKDLRTHSAGVLLCFLLPLANSHTYTHVNTYMELCCQSGAVWMTCGLRHNFLPCGKRECCSLLKTLADFSFSHQRRDGNSSTSSLPCTLYAHSSAMLPFFFFFFYCHWKVSLP